MVNMHLLENLSIPELVYAFRFKNICHSTMKYFKVPRSVRVLGSNSILMHDAVVDATEVEYFMEDSVVCKKLIIGDRVKYIAYGAFRNVESLKTLELKLYKFIEAFFPLDGIACSDHGLKYVQVTRQDGSTLNLVFSIPKEQKYRQFILSSWGEDGISIERYIDALVQIKNAEVKYKVIAYCLEHNSGKLVEELLSRIGSIVKGLISWAIKQESFDTVTLLCKSGILKPALAKELLKGKLPNVLIPAIMNVLEDKKQAANLSL